MTVPRTDDWQDRADQQGAIIEQLTKRVLQSLHVAGPTRGEGVVALLTAALYVHVGPERFEAAASLTPDDPGIARVISQYETVGPERITHFLVATARYLQVRMANAAGRSADAEG